MLSKSDQVEPARRMERRGDTDRPQTLAGLPSLAMQRWSSQRLVAIGMAVSAGALLATAPVGGAVPGRRSNRC